MNPYDQIVGILDETHAWGFDGSRSGGFSRAVLSHPRQAGKVALMNQSRTQVIEARLRDLEAELAVIKRYGEDTYDEGAVLTFKGDFGNEGGIRYAYAAIKAGGKWHLTGGAKTPSYIGWDDLVQFFIRANVQKVRLVTETEKVVG